MNSKKWFYLFSIFSLVSLLLAALLNIYIDPYKVFNQSWRIKYVSDRNGQFSKLERLKKSSGVECLLLGSSRSEFFFPSDIQEQMGLKTFSASMGSAFTYTKYAFGLKGLELLPDLKEIWYVSDFYEFNEKEMTWLLAELEQFNKYFTSPEFEKVRPSKFRRFKSMFSLNTFSASIKTIKDKLKNKKKSYLEDGSTTVSLTQKDFDELRKEITKIENHYLNDKWSGFQELSPLSIDMISNLILEAKKHNKEMKVILTPLHPVLFKRFSQNPVLIKLWREWKIFWQNAADAGGITLYDFTDSEKYFEPNSEYWQDGVHFSRKASVELLHRIKGE